MKLTTVFLSLALTVMINSCCSINFSNAVSEDTVNKQSLKIIENILSNSDKIDSFCRDTNISSKFLLKTFENNEYKLSIQKLIKEYFSCDCILENYQKKAVRSDDESFKLAEIYTLKNQSKDISFIFLPIGNNGFLLLDQIVSNEILK